MTKVVGLVMLMFLLAGCRNSGSNPVTTLPDSDAYGYLPLAKGNYWALQQSGNGWNGSKIREIRTVINDTNHNILYGYVESVINDPLAQDAPATYYYVKKNGGIYLLQARSDIRHIDGSPFFSSEQLLLKSPVKIGANWVDGNSTWSIVDIVELSLHGNTFPQTAVVSNGIETIWFAKNVGIVKQQVVSLPQPGLNDSPNVIQELRSFRFN